VRGGIGWCDPLVRGGIGWCEEAPVGARWHLVGARLVDDRRLLRRLYPAIGCPAPCTSAAVKRQGKLTPLRH
jgi:hypothetical protein